MTTPTRRATLRFIAATSLVATLALAGCEIGSSGATDTEFEDTVAAATAEGKLVIASFTADWCAPCKRMEATTWKDPALLAWVDEHAVRVLVDIDKRGALARDHGVRSIPAVLVFDGDVELGRYVGLRSAEDMITAFESLRARRASQSDGDVDTALVDAASTFGVDTGR